MSGGVIGDAVSGMVSGILGSPLLTRLADLIPDPIERARQMAELETQIIDVTNKSDLAQMAINANEAQNDNIFVSGWRPFIGWVCGTAFAYHFIAQPLVLFIASAMGDTIAIPTFDMGTLSEVLFGMLGLGTLRTIDKHAPQAIRAMTGKSDS